MIPLKLNFVVDKGPLTETTWPDLKRENCIHLGNDSPGIGVAVLDAGMASGPSFNRSSDRPARR